MTEKSVIRGETIAEDGVERRATLRKDYGTGVRHRDEPERQMWSPDKAIALRAVVERA